MQSQESNGGISRRSVLKGVSGGFGYMALAGLATEAAARAAGRSPGTPHHAPRAKHVIFLCMRGGPSHVDTFDHKPQLSIDSGQNSGAAFNGRPSNRKLLGSPWEFHPAGDSGLMISDLFPHLAAHADSVCLLNGMHAEIPNHPQAYLQLHTGDFRFVRPSVGSWVLYGLGTENDNLPGFIVISPEARLGGAQNYGNAFLPAVYQGTAIGRQGQSLQQARFGNVSGNPLPEDLQREQLNLIQQMNRELLREKHEARELEGVIRSFELGFRMQSAVPELMDLSDEPEHVLRDYGIGDNATDNFGRQCLMARRFVESGVRFVECTHSNWDQHNNLKQRLEANCRATDQPIAALISDLKRRGLLEETLIVWGGEFGRTPHVRRNNGRDHNATGFTMWMAGGGVRGGMRYGATDDYGIEAVDGKMHFHDLHATMLHLLGLDHQRLTYRYAGRDFRLTDVYGRVVEEILA